jgi:RecA/RadA recombinase
MRKSVKATDIKEAVRKTTQKETSVEFISTGSTLLNLAASGKGRGGGWARGRIINVVGDGNSGKTLISLEACANALYHIQQSVSKIYPKVEKVTIVYNNVEGVMDFPIGDMFGSRFVNEIEWIQTSTAEDFGKDYQKRVKQLKSGEFLLYVLDSIDALVSEASAERMDKILKDQKPDGSYGTEKAKFFSAEFFNHLCGAMEGKDATLILISQVREKIGISFGEKYYRTGGKALDFYTHQVVWLAQTDRLSKTHKTQTRVYGVKIKARFKRNKVWKPLREAEFPILFDYGIDEVGSLVDYYFGPKAKEVEWNGEDFKPSELVTLLDTNPEELNKLRDLVEQQWEEIEEAVKPIRQNRWE